MGFEKVYITKQGALLAAKTLQGKKIQFDHAEIGSGNLSGNAADKTALTTKVLECPIEETKITGIHKQVYLLFLKILMQEVHFILEKLDYLQLIRIQKQKYYMLMQMQEVMQNI